MKKRDHLIKLLMGGVQKVRKLKRAQILLKADDDWTDKQIADALHVGQATAEQTRKRYTQEAWKLRAMARSQNAFTNGSMDGEVEARLIALVTSSPPEGHKRWTLRLLAEHLAVLEPRMNSASTTENPVETGCVAYPSTSQCASVQLLIVANEFIHRLAVMRCVRTHSQTLPPSATE